MLPQHSPLMRSCLVVALFRPCGADTYCAFLCVPPCRPPLHARLSCVCSQAGGSRSLDKCCENQRNECQKPFPWCFDRTSSSDYLYRLGPGEPERYVPTGRDNYFQTSSMYWPAFGSNGGDELSIFGGGTVPESKCNQGSTYDGIPNAACGGDNNWGRTDLEVWRPLYDL